MAKATTVSGRLLLDTTINGNSYPINSVVILSQTDADNLVAQGALDTSPEAVAYATEQGSAAIDLTA
jgi:hypothetical protein